MMGSGLADLIGSAFGGVGSIMAQGKPWVRAMRSFRMVSSVILQSFLQTGFKTWDEICEYLEKARLHPTGRHWVDNLITPTLLIDQLLRSEREGDWLFQQLCIRRLLPYFFYRWPPQLCKIPLMASPRNGYTIACHGKVWPTLWSICLQTQGG